MEDQSNGRGRHAAPDADADQPVDADAGSDQAAARSVRGKDNDRGAEPGTATPAGDRATALASLTKATEALTHTQWAILKELRNGRKYRKNNPPPAKAAAGLGHCGVCGTWRDSFDGLVHHQFTAHPEIFAGDGELLLEPPACMCTRCAGPEPYHEWLDTPECRGAHG